ncbi:MAG TPA: ABC transporter permease [Methanosarcinaceae archaeon]|nr:ABC transporter permease [Methanosarcinaceae archaeon]
MTLRFKQNKLPGKRSIYLLKHKSVAIGSTLIVMLAFLAIFAPYLTPYDPIEVDLYNNIQSPSWEHPFGTDNLGRDVLTRVIYATRIDILASIFIVGISMIIGISIGIVSGYYGGVIDKVLVGMMDTFLALPEIILALVLVGALGPGLFNVTLALSLLGWVKYARVSRGLALSIKEKEFIEAMKAVGVNDFYLLTRHIAPNTISPLLTLAALHLGHAILSLAALGFLGLGAQPPMPEWGAMLNEGRIFLRGGWWLSIFPGLMIMITVLAFNFIGDGLRDALDPRMKEVVIK